MKVFGEALDVHRMTGRGILDSVYILRPADYEGFVLSLAYGVEI